MNSITIYLTDSEPLERPHFPTAFYHQDPSAELQKTHIENLSFVVTSGLI